VVTEDSNSIYWKTIEGLVGALTSQKLAEGVVNTAIEITNGDTNRIGVLTTDTCPGMIALHNVLHADPKTKHMLTIFCNSHSLQLLIDDILTLPGIEEFWKLTANTANGLRNAAKQYAYLQSEKMKVYGHKKAIILPGEARWETQYQMAMSLENSCQALRQFAVHPEVSFNYTINLLDHSFWGRLIELLKLLEPLHKA
jgi:hypothetical protein